jgi:hypothetical protein
LALQKADHACGDGVSIGWPVGEASEHRGKFLRRHRSWQLRQRGCRMPRIDVETGERGKDAQRPISFVEYRSEEKVVELGSENRT